MNNYKKLNIIILYKNDSYKIIPYPKLEYKHISDTKKVKLILIPLLETPNVYIPVKPSKHYNFSKVNVDIIYQPFLYDYEGMEGTSYHLTEFKNECNNIIDFINSIYNLYKFRGSGIFILENSNLDGHAVYAIQVRQIKLDFFNEVNECIYSLDSGIMEDMEIYTPETFYMSPPPYVGEDRFITVKEFLYIPDSFDKDFSIADVEKLYGFIKLNNDDLSWSKVNKPTKELGENDYVLYKVENYEVYYLTTFELIKKFMSFPSFYIEFITLVPDLYDYEYDKDYYDLVRKRNMTEYERQVILDTYEDHNYVNITESGIMVSNIENLMIVIIFFSNIINTINYLILSVYNADTNNTNIKTFALCYKRIYDNLDKILITDEEAQDYDNILNLINRIINKE